MPKPDAPTTNTFKSPKELSKWLQVNHAAESELWIKIFKKGSGIASVTRDEVVIEMLCRGGIDGVKKSLDDQAYLQRITPRKTRSNWSKENTEHVERLISEGQMKEPGLVHVHAAKADGRWENAYAPASEMKIPTDFLSVLEKKPKAKQFYEPLTKPNRYAIAYRLETARKTETRKRRFKKYMEMLIREEKLTLASTKEKRHSKSGHAANFVRWTRCTTFCSPMPEAFTLMTRQV